MVLEMSWQTIEYSLFAVNNAYLSRRRSLKVCYAWCIEVIAHPLSNGLAIQLTQTRGLPKNILAINAPRETQHPPYRDCPLEKILIPYDISPVVGRRWSFCGRRSGFLAIP